MTSYSDSNDNLEARISGFIKESLGAQRVSPNHQLQSLWGGQGSILRWSTDASGHESVIIKHIAPSRQASHPRGWNTDRSFSRKSRSYEVECHWYEQFANRCTQYCKTAQMLGLHRDSESTLLLLEDLSIDYPRLRDRLNIEEAFVCLQWLAEFHARFLHVSADGLWERGCYWHLDTRPDEWQAMEPGPLQRAARWLDERLKGARYQTLVHGDAKLANFCFTDDMHKVSAVDFQYVGRGCGMSDVVYFLGSCLSEADCREHEERLLSHYFSALQLGLLRRAMQAQKGNGIDDEFKLTPVQAKALEEEWRSLYAVAWSDFHRFLLGWMPEHSKINGYSRELVQQALRSWPATSLDDEASEVFN